MRSAKFVGVLALSLFSGLAFRAEADSHGRHYYHYYPRYYYARPYWGGYYSYRYGFYPYAGFYYGGYYGPPYPYAHVYYGDPSREPSELRIEVKPVEAEVYVDGYLAGSVDEFDGFFQRLHLPPGAHEIVIYLDGFRTIREKLYLAPGASYKIRRAMEPLAEGETNEQRPEPPPEPPPERKTAVQSEPEERTLSEEPPAPVSGFGVLELRVQPEDVEILIDGDPWPTGGPSEAIAIHLPAGEHRIEIRRAGHPSFATDVEVESGKTTTLNVKLP
jgi:hypothetical protein